MVNFPFSIDDETTLFLTANNLRTNLTSPIDDSTLTIPVLTTSGFPNSGFITILTGTDITDAEAISYDGYLSTAFSGTLRGAGGTEAVSHNSTDNVDFTIVADHHNSLKDAVIAIENFVGVSGSENFLTVTMSGNITVTGTANFCGESFFSEDSKWKPKDSPPVTIIFANNDSEVTVAESPDSTNMKVGIISDPLIDGIEYFIIYYAQYGMNSGGTGARGVLRYSNSAVTEDTEYRHGPTPQGGGDEWSSFGNQPHVATISGTGNPQTGITFGSSGRHGPLQGFTTITGTGDSRLYFTTQEVGTTPSLGSAPMSNQTIIAMPLNDLTEGVDYFKFVDNNPIDFDFVMDSPASGFGNPGNIIFEETINIKSANSGNYIALASVEMEMDLSTVVSDGGETLFSVDGIPISEIDRRHALVNLRESYSFAIQNVIDLSAGDHTLLIEGATISGSTIDSHYRRPRFFLFKADSFDQVVSGTVQISDSEGVNDTDYHTFDEISQTYIPNQPEQYIIISHYYSASHQQAQPNRAQLLGSEDGAIREHTYWTARSTSSNLLDDFDGDVQGLIMPHLVTATGTNSQTWDLQYGKIHIPLGLKQLAYIGRVPKEGESLGVEVQTTMLLWSMTPSTSEGIACTTVATSGIVTPGLIANTIAAINGLTVSGISVNIGEVTPDTLQATYDIGNGIISTTAGKPFRLDGTGELVAVTGTFTQGLTVTTTGYIENLNVTSTAVNFANLPTASAGLFPGELWIDTSTYNLRVTPA